VQPKSEQPYHIQAIYDLQADYSSEHFRYAIGQCRKVIEQVVADDDRSEKQIARVHILRYLDLLLSRAVVWVDCEADLLAIVLRSEIELRGWAELVSESLEICTLLLIHSMRGCCKISLEAGIQKNQPVWRGKLAGGSTEARGIPEFFLSPPER
jgi:hypothetical protein